MFRLANRHTGNLAIIIADEAASAFPVNSHYTVTIVGHSLKIRPDANGRSTATIPAAYKCAGYSRMITSMCAAHLPSFRVDSVEFKVEDDDTLSYEIPPLHELEWTTTPPRGGKTALIPTIIHNLRCRLASAAACGVGYSAVLCKIPTWARGQLPGSQFSAIVREFFV